MSTHDDELEVQQAISGYLLAAGRFNDLVNRKEEVSSKAVRDVAWFAAAVFYTYNLPSNWQPDGRPRIPIPRQLARGCREEYSAGSVGQHPTWMLHLTSKGAPAADPVMRRGIGVAVAYLKLCSAGHLRDKHPTKTIADRFGVSRRCVQGWEKEYEYSEPSDWFPQAADEAERARLISAALPKAAGRYRQWGRGPKNPRPHGKAHRRLGAKR